MVPNSQGTVSRVSQPLLCFCLHLGTWLTKFLKISTKKCLITNYCIDVNQKWRKTNFLCSNEICFSDQLKKMRVPGHRCEEPPSIHQWLLSCLKRSKVSHRRRNPVSVFWSVCLSFYPSFCLSIRLCQSIRWRMSCVLVWLSICLSLSVYLFLSFVYVCNSVVLLLFESFSMCLTAKSVCLCLSLLSGWLFVILFVCQFYIFPPVSVCISVHFCVSVWPSLCLCSCFVSLSVCISINV